MKESLKSALFQLKNKNLVNVGMSPAEISFGRNIKGPLPILNKRLNIEKAVYRKEEHYNRLDVC